MSGSLAPSVPSDAAELAARVAALAVWRHATPEEGAADEAFWRAVGELFAVDRGILNLNNGGVSPSPLPVLLAQKRYLDQANLAPAHTLWEQLVPRREEVRGRLAELFGCAADEIAISRNASEALQTCQLGFPLERGDEVLTTTVDYARMLTTWRQRERRDGIVVRSFALPIPAEDPDEIVDLFARNLTPKTRLVLLSHVVYLTGQVMPVARVVQMAHERGVPVVVDGAHAFAHLLDAKADLGCDVYAASLHKWLSAPHGTGLLYVRRDRIQDFWPLMAAPEAMDADIRKFEETGTHPAAPYLAVHEALDLHLAIGAERKLARLTYLRDRWAHRLLAGPHGSRVHLLTSLKPGLGCGFATFHVDGLPAARLAEHLWTRHRVLVTPFTHAEFEGIRVTPAVYTTAAEVDRFSEVLEEALGELGGGE